MLDAVMLSRIQFGFTIGFHILFPTLNLGLAMFIAIMEGMWLKTGQKKYLQICKFWTKVFALTFGMGVVSGIVLSYELGTNFGPFTKAIGGVLGGLFAYEVLTAFFLEAGFLGIMLFGWDKVGKGLHYLATLLVTIGTALSAFWIMSANSWMQYPAGFVLRDGIFVVTSWWQVVFNPTFLPRFFHMLFASYVTTCFVIAGISAWYLLRNRYVDISRTCFSVAMWAAVILIPIQIFLGDIVGLNVHQYQPLKTAAMEGVWNTGPSQPLLLFAIPDQQAQKNYFEIGIPYGASLINTHEWEGVLTGLKSVPTAQQPPVAPVFFGFRIMVGLGVLMFLIALYAFYLRLRKKLFDSKLLLYAAMYATPFGFLATLAGWITAEIGRQPWIVYHLMLTIDGAAPVPFAHIAISLFLFVVIYFTIFGFYLLYLFKLIQKGYATSAKATEDEVAEHAFQYMHQGAEK